jgi:photosystem II stability/assembly factor-like uncharacterized protein
MQYEKYLSGETDFFVGKRGRLKRYLICAAQGYFPVLVKTGSSSLAVIFRTGGMHMGISATLAVATSKDGGKSWTDPVEVTPRWEDARNPALGVNKNGDLIVALWKGKQCYVSEEGEARKWDPKTATEGDYTFTTLSSDNGKTWSELVPLKVNGLKLISPYGRIITAPDGTLIMSVYGNSINDIESKENELYIIRSKDDGKTWGDQTLVVRDYNETSFAFMPDGTLVAAARNWSKGAYVSILTSNDMGYSWSEPKQVTRSAEHPADLTLLKSGKLLMTFGRRIRPMGCGALISEDGGKTWNVDREILLAGDGVESGDLGYPSTIQLDDGTIVTALYYASGSEMTKAFFGWGTISCQALHYKEEDIL